MKEHRPKGSPATNKYIDIGNGLFPLKPEDQITDDSASPTTGKITLDILQQKGWKPRADYVIEHIPSFVAHYLGIPRTVEDLCSKADSYIDPLLKKSSWYAETVNEEREVPPASHASVSFKDFMKWSLDCWE